MAETILIVDDQASKARLLKDILEREGYRRHPPPVILRQGGECEILDKGGPIIGLGGVLPFEDGRIFSEIVSGGQTGVDQGALEAALDLNRPCGGWCPKGRFSEAGIIPAVFPVREHPSIDYRDRTIANVRDSDGTLLFTFGEPSGGTAYTLEQAEAHSRPYCLVDLNEAVPEVITKDDGVFVFRQALKERPEQPDVQAIRNWGCKHAISVLNVAGPRESNHPGIQQIVKTVMLRVLRSY